jgi:hypothetical protein
MTSLQQTAMGGGAATAKTASYVLVAADAGTTVAMNAAGATTITVNTGLFAAGDTVFIQNLGAGACTVTAGTATVATAGSLILPQNDAGILYFTATGSAIFYDYIQAGAVSPLTTKGDLYTFSTSDARLGVGANGTTLVADSSEATGLKWAAAGGGMTLISETVASAISSLSFGSISGSYKQLYLVWSGIRHSGTGSGFSIRLNNNSGSVYAVLVGGQSSDTNNIEGTTTTQISSSNYSPFGLNANAGSLVVDSKGYLVIDNYASSTKAKTFYGQWNCLDNTGGVYRIAQSNIGVFNSTTAITSIDIFRTAGSATFSNTGDTTIRLYGVA